MKIKNVLTIAVLLIIAGVNSGLMAQTALRALVKKCESAENVEMSIVRRKDQETLKVKRSVVTIKIMSNKALVDEFIAAFEKDEPSAYEAIYSKKDGKMMPQHFKFKGVIFTFSYKNSNVWGGQFIMDPDLMEKASSMGVVMNGFQSLTSSNDKEKSKDKTSEKQEIVHITMIEDN